MGAGGFLEGTHAVTVRVQSADETYQYEQLGNWRRNMNPHPCRNSPLSALLMDARVDDRRMLHHAPRMNDRPCLFYSKGDEAL